MEIWNLLEPFWPNLLYLRWPTTINFSLCWRFEVGKRFSIICATGCVMICTIWTMTAPSRPILVRSSGPFCSFLKCKSHTSKINKNHCKINGFGNMSLLEGPQSGANLTLFLHRKSSKKHEFSMVFAKIAFPGLAFQESCKKSIFRSQGGSWEQKSDFALVLLEISVSPALCRRQGGTPPRAGKTAVFTRKSLFSSAGAVFRHTVFSASKVPALKQACFALQSS